MLFNQWENYNLLGTKARKYFQCPTKYVCIYIEIKPSAITYQMFIINISREWGTKALETSTVRTASALFLTLSYHFHVVVCFVFLLLLLLLFFRWAFVRCCSEAFTTPLNARSRFFEKPTKFCICICACVWLRGDIFILFDVSKRILVSFSVCVVV